MLQEYIEDAPAELAPGKSRDAEAEAEARIQSLLQIYSSLRAMADLKPSPVIDELFRSLVNMCTQNLSTHATQAILQDPRISSVAPSLRAVCARAECHLEAHWAAIVNCSANENNAYQALKRFPYFNNYVALTNMELSAIRAVSPCPPRKVAFIGSGPLPLTSLCLRSALCGNTSDWADASLMNSCSCISPDPVLIVNIDSDLQAVTDSRNLCQKLGSRARGMQFVCEEAGAPYLELAQFDIVYLAALVGTSQVEKEMLLIKVVAKMSVGSLLLLRTAHSLRTLLYPEFDAMSDAVSACLEVLLIVHPYNQIVNSVLIGRVKPRLRVNIDSRGLL